MAKKGNILSEYTAWVFLAILVLVLFLTLYFIMRDSGGGVLAFIRDRLNFG